MKKFIAILLSTFTLAANAEVGQGGMSECMSQSIQAALDVYALTSTFSPLPSVTIGKSDESPSNGIDLMVKINNGATYYIIASPNSKLNEYGVPVELLGCTGARVISKK